VEDRRGQLAHRIEPEIKIDAKTPPTFIAQANDDKASLAEGALSLSLRCAK
jgi:hypothetical protein